MRNTTKYAVRRMEESDLEEIVERVESGHELYVVGRFSKKALKEAFETDPTQNMILERNEGIAGFAFCGIKHELDERHPITVGYVGYLSAPTVFRGHASRKTKKLLWESAIASLNERGADVARWIIYGDPSPRDFFRGDIEIARELGFFKNELSKNEKAMIDGKRKNAFYVPVRLPLSAYREQMPSKKYKIRQMREKDVNEASKILDMSFDPFETHSSTSEIRAKMEIGAAWVCKHEQKVVGCAFSPIYEDKTVVELQGQAVHPDYRGRGIATEMTKAILNYLKDEGVGVVVAGIRNNNLTEYNVLSRLGFEIAAGETWMFCKDFKNG